MIAQEPLTVGRGTHIAEPNPVPSKITYTLISQELNELRHQVARMQRDKSDLEHRLQEYENQRQR
jgi:hypothetical protein